MEMDTPERSKVGGAPLANKFEVFLLFLSVIDRNADRSLNFLRLSELCLLYLGYWVRLFAHLGFHGCLRFGCWICTDLLENLKKYCFLALPVTRNLLVTFLWCLAFGN